MRSLNVEELDVVVAGVDPDVEFEEEGPEEEGPEEEGGPAGEQP